MGQRHLLTLKSDDGDYYLDGIILIKGDGTELKIIPTTYSYPMESVPSATVTVTDQNEVISDVPETYIPLGDGSDYLVDTEEYAAFMRKPYKE